MLLDQGETNVSRVFSSDLSKTVNNMLESVVSESGTGKNAMIPHYRVAGKTATLHKVKAGGGYDENKYVSAFAGFSPASNPRVVTVVIIDEPSEGKYFGGLVAAPIFSKVTERAFNSCGYHLINRVAAGSTMRM